MIHRSRADSTVGTREPALASPCSGPKVGPRPSACDDSPSTHSTLTRSGLDDTAFEAAFRAHYDVVYRFVARRLPAGAEEATDLVQETFLRLWKSDDPPTDERLRSHLITIANRLVIDRYRRRAVRDAHAAAEATRPPPTIAPIEDVEIEPAVREAIAALPGTLRETFLLSRIDGLSYREISEVQGVSVKAIEARMSKALRSLRTALAPFLGALGALLLSGVGSALTSLALAISGIGTVLVSIAVLGIALWGGGP